MYHARYDVQVILDYEYIKDKIKDLHWKEKDCPYLSEDIILQILAEYAAVLHGTARMSEVYLTVVIDPPNVYICTKEKQQLYVDPARVHLGNCNKILDFHENDGIGILSYYLLQDYNNVQAMRDAWWYIKDFMGLL